MQFGAFFVGKRQQNVNNTLSLPSYLRVDVGVKYQMEHVNSIFTVKVENVFDKAYWSSAGAKGICLVEVEQLWHLILIHFNERFYR
ncbi:TonB-dependent receptor [Thalassotalea sp. PP2-459]|uniref:TonB-dependent receptor n=1 Tax=Thalassotalea sp. PP2-459 TaxID=1742724 RepID=UPI000944717D|nr:TonB-dependent receptor [Thalassotalea sp. PP2-459]OKY27308.1 hypothetical protein BI291_00305 [Thalassotalea sp. PP2-459]